MVSHKKKGEIQGQGLSQGVWLVPGPEIDLMKDYEKPGAAVPAGNSQ